MKRLSGQKNKQNVIKQDIFSGTSTWLLLLILFCSGCSTMNLQSMTKLAKFEKKPEFETPLQVIPVWSDTVLHQTGKTGTRGFGGRVIFYGENKEKAIRVDGTLIVYAWDDTAEVANRQADRKYVFKAEKLQEHYSNSKIGHSYNFWLPWDAAGGDQERISLIIRFIGTNGAEVNSEPTNVVLPGPIKKPESMLAKRNKKHSRLQSPRTAREVIEDSRLLPATHETYAGESTVAPNTSPIQQTRFVQHRNHESIKPAHSLQTSEITLTNGFIERNMRGNQVGFSSEDLFAPEEKEAASSKTKAMHSLPQRNRREVRPNERSETTEPTTQSSMRSQPFQSRVRTTRAAPQFHGRVRREPLLAKSLNGLPQTPRSESRVAP